MIYNYFNLDSMQKSAARLTLAPKQQDFPRGAKYIYPEERKPLKNNDVLRVFHAFRDIEDAVSACRHGLSGRTRASRVYSYESDNNPHGLFVSPSLDAVKQFGEYIIEFNARVSELEAPVWPSGTYTVQGQYAQYFAGDKRKREKARKQARERALQTGIASITESDRPELANLLFWGGEPQALFVGHLQPNRIIRVWLRDDRGGQAKSIAREEFLEQNSDVNFSANTESARAENRVFRVDEEFDAQQFVERLNARYGKRYPLTIDQLVNALGSDDTRTMQNELNRYVWPKQMPKALLWLGREHRKNKNR